MRCRRESHWGQIAMVNLLIPNNWDCETFWESLEHVVTILLWFFTSYINMFTNIYKEGNCIGSENLFNTKTSYLKEQLGFFIIEKPNVIKKIKIIKIKHMNFK